MKNFFYCDTWRVPEGYPPGITILVFKIIIAMVFTPGKEALGCQNSQNNQPSPWGGCLFWEGSCPGALPYTSKLFRRLNDTWP
jgi:hypothetical protein